MYEIEYTGLFKRKVKLLKKRGYDLSLLESVIAELKETGTLQEKYQPHKLAGNHAGFWECHIKPDWLLVWAKEENRLVLVMIDTGTHSDIFG
ncbi:MAG: type II toxin-antitoxin system YafQ family toxin [Prevotella sp.]|jgi:mRNA interferase YafQ|nr:type II toxin-antitoxin system YafQ family toxin [Prevotella sp.]